MSYYGGYETYSIGGGSSSSSGVQVMRPAQVMRPVQTIVPAPPAPVYSGSYQTQTIVPAPPALVYGGSYQTQSSPPVQTHAPIQKYQPAPAPVYHNEVHVAAVDPMQRFYMYDTPPSASKPTYTPPPADTPGTYTGGASPIFNPAAAPEDHSVASKGQKITRGFDCMLDECGKPMYRFYWDVRDVCARDEYCKAHLPDEVLAFDKNHNGRFSIREYSDMMCEGAKVYNYYKSVQGVSDAEKLAKNVPVLKAGDMKFLDSDQNGHVCPVEYETWFVETYELVKVDPTDPIIRSKHRLDDPDAAQPAEATAEELLAAARDVEPDPELDAAEDLGALALDGACSPVLCEDGAAADEEGNRVEEILLSDEEADLSMI